MPASRSERQLLNEIRRSTNNLSRHQRRVSFPPSLRMPHDDRHYPAPEIPTAVVRRTEPGEVVYAELAPPLVPESHVRLITGRSLGRVERQNSRIGAARRGSFLGRALSSRQNNVEPSGRS